MGRKKKYTIEHVRKVKEFINNNNVSKKKAIEMAGFSDSSSYYLTVKRLKLKEQLFHIKSGEHNFI